MPLFAGHLGKGSRRGLERQDLDHYSSEFIIAAVLSLISPFSDWFVMQCSVSQAALNEHTYAQVETFLEQLHQNFIFLFEYELPPFQGWSEIGKNVGLHCLIGKS